MAQGPRQPVSVAVDCQQRNGEAIDPGIFGRFNEHLGSAVYPGVYEDYVVNGSFDVWNAGRSSSSGLTFLDVEDHDDLAFPWEPVSTDDGVRFSREIGGVRGRTHDEALERGLEVPESKQLSPQGITESRYQRLEIDGDGGIGQRTALPDHRVSSFDVSFSIRGTVSECTVNLKGALVDEEVLARETVAVERDWTRHTVQLTLERESPQRFRDSRYGEYALTFEAEGGAVDLDWVTLIPTDAVDGKFNPTTIDLLREFQVTSIRWPGGNYASQYRWRNGVGPVEERPVVPIVNWGGLEPNYLGTNEWLRFCELVDVEPYITVPFWSATGPEEAAKWVEYVNGSTDTEMGALRAEHGYPEPWDVTWWNVGNETWGSWQVGRTDAEDYATRYREYHEAMRAVDPDIEIDAIGIDPWFTLVHDGAGDADDRSAPPVWNEILFRHAADTLEGIDLHRYTEGISDHTSEPGAREAWLAEHGEDPIGYNEVLVNDPGSWDRMLDEIRDLASEHDIDDLRITVGEWGLRSNEVEDDWPRADRSTMAHAVYATRALQSFVRNKDVIDLCHWTDFSLYVHPHPDGVSSPHPAAYVFKRVAGQMLSTSDDWCEIETDVENSPTRERPRTGVSILESEDVPLVDAVTIGTTGAERRTQTILVNGSLRQAVDVQVDFRGDGAAGTWIVEVFEDEDGDPFAEQPSGVPASGFHSNRSEIEGPEGTIDLSLNPGSVALLSRNPGP